MPQLLFLGKLEKSQGDGPKKPERMREKHPELYSMLEIIFTDVNK
jgi:hypothetical protein